MNLCWFSITEIIILLVFLFSFHLCIFCFYFNFSDSFTNSIVFCHFILFLMYLLLQIYYK